MYNYQLRIVGYALLEGNAPRGYDFVEVIGNPKRSLGVAGRVPANGLQGVLISVKIPIQSRRENKVTELI